MNISVQLYTVRDLVAKDLPGTLKELAKIGYKAAEFGGTWGSAGTAANAKKAMDDAGVVCSGMHAPIDALEKDLAKVMTDAEALDNKNIICPWLPEERRKTADAWKKCAESLTKIGYECHQRGFQFCYHNHSFEFQKFDGKTGLDILLENADANLVESELDVYWVKHGGEDPVKMIERLGERVHLLHLKDMSPGPEKRFAPVGTAILDWPGILAAAKKAEVQWGAVEQDNCYEKTPLEAITISLQNLKKLGPE